jgi:hypothetical protein
MNFSELPPGPTRAQLRALIIETPPFAGCGPPPPYTVQTVEVINSANGRTVFALSAPPPITLVPPPVND